MGLRFRKSINLGSGVKLNLNKSSIGLSTGVKGARLSTNSSGRKTASVGVPGTGLYYTKSLNNKKPKNSYSDNHISSGEHSDDNNYTENNQQPQKPQKKGDCLKSLFVAFCFIVVLGSCLNSCISKDESPTEPTEKAVDEVVNSKVVDNTPDLKVNDVLNRFGTEKIGEWASLSMSKNDALKMTDSEFDEIVKKYVADGKYNWVTIFFDDGTGIKFTSPSMAGYGEVDDEGTLTNTIGYIYSNSGGTYRYEEYHPSQEVEDNSSIDLPENPTKADEPENNLSSQGHNDESSAKSSNVIVPVILPSEGQTVTGEQSYEPIKNNVEDDELIVYWGETGTKYHIDPKCRSFKGNTPNSGSIEDAQAEGRTGWCGICSKGMK